jgi:hypothetical protein
MAFIDDVDGSVIAQADVLVMDQKTFDSLREECKEADPDAVSRPDRLLGFRVDVVASEAEALNRVAWYRLQGKLAVAIGDFPDQPATPTGEE